MSDARIKLKEMEAELPVQDNGFYLSLILGKNLNLSLMSKHDRYRYKQVVHFIEYNFRDY
uniref:YhcG_C domain-containing protein n=1 Tax=Heterorhabditis bacteriophora TaxID=37862 RepID=A0A1I7XB85_HETBA